MGTGIVGILFHLIPLRSRSIPLYLDWVLRPERRPVRHRLRHVRRAIRPLPRDLGRHDPRPNQLAVSRHLSHGLCHVD